MPGINTTTHPTATAYSSTGSVIISWIDSILNRIPLPRWAIYTLFALGLFFILLMICCCCCCCRKKKEKGKAKQKIKPGTVQKSFEIKRVQPGIKTPKKLQENVYRPQLQFPMENQKEEVHTDTKGQKKRQENKYRGRLLYSVEYNYKDKEITVGVKQAASLMAMDSGGTSDPYVIVYLTNDTRKENKTKVHCKTLNPIFNESFTFKFSLSEMKDTQVVMQVYSKHDVIGEVRLILQDMDLQQVIEEWKDLNAVEYERFGEICFSLKYIPVISKLTIVILEAKNLKKMDSDGFSDPFVKVQLFLNKKLKHKKKTGVKKNTLDPYFNEKFTFHVTLEQIQDVELIISVWDHNKINRNKQIGKISLGCRASGNALKHWSDMLINPRSAIVGWHSLQESS